jgi:hypothetical protein
MFIHSSRSPCPPGMARPNWAAPPPCTLPACSDLQPVDGDWWRYRPAGARVGRCSSRARGRCGRRVRGAGRRGGPCWAIGTGRARACRRYLSSIGCARQRLAASASSHRGAQTGPSVDAAKGQNALVTRPIERPFSGIVRSCPDLSASTTEVSNGSRVHQEHTGVHSGRENGSDLGRSPRSEP